MKRFALITGSALFLALAACNSTSSTTAPGAVGSSTCCKENKAVTCDAATKAACSSKDKAAKADAAATPAAAAPGAVSGQKKSGCGACPMSGKSNG
ncbi:MAG: hypothetical protein EXS03_04465 [Phycisphaerales bacterium]|nr:hypothetical protein [Phycisphaerales bacterium]